MISAVPALLSMLAISAAENFAIVDVDAADAMMGLGAQVTRQLVEGAEAQKLHALTPDQLRAQLTPEKYAALKKCRDNPACVAQALSGTAITRVITGSLSRDEKHYLLKLWHHDVKGSTIVCDVDRSVLIAARRFQKDVEQAVPPLLRGEREARGTLIIDTNVPTAQISVNGEFIGTPPVTMTVKPGKYEVKIEKNKYLPVARLFTVEANQTTSEKIKLLLIPGQTADDELAPKLVAKKADEAAGVSLSIPTWVFGGVTIAAGLSASIFGILAGRAETSLRGGLDEMTGVYQGTRAQALEQNRNALIANVSFIALAVAAVATAVFLILDLVSHAEPAPATGATP
ncbi:MAG: PEGA domain-containing protein [Myxococcales bacterium]|nr:PEGA domain-containing protein [Myxococcales bacterium]